MVLLPIFNGFLPLKGHPEFSGAFFLAKIFEKVSFDNAMFKWFWTIFSLGVPDEESDIWYLVMAVRGTYFQFRSAAKKNQETI